MLRLFLVIFTVYHLNSSSVEMMKSVTCPAHLRPTVLAGRDPWFPSHHGFKRSWLPFLNNMTQPAHLGYLPPPHIQSSIFRECSFRLGERLATGLVVPSLRTCLPLQSVGTPILPSPQAGWRWECLPLVIQLTGEAAASTLSWRTRCKNKVLGLLP